MPRITNPDDQEYVRDLVPDAERDLIDTLSALGRGQGDAFGGVTVARRRE